MILCKSLSAIIQQRYHVYVVIYNILMIFCIYMYNIGTVVVVVILL